MNEHDEAAPTTNARKTNASQLTDPMGIEAMTTTLDCTDIQAMLSGLVDDEVDQSVRYAAERHLAGCPDCRARLDAAEAQDRTMAMMMDDDAGGGLPDGFAGSVLAQTAWSERRASRDRAFGWLGWMVAAASLAVAAVVWQFGPTLSNSGGMNSGGDIVLSPVQTDADWAAPRSYMRSHTLTSLPATNDGIDGSVNGGPGDVSMSDMSDSTGSMGMGSPTFALSSLEAHAADLSADLLELLTDVEATDFGAVEHLRRIIEYDDVIERLSTLETIVPEAERFRIFAARSILSQVAGGPMDRVLLRELREQATDLDLATILRSISARGTRSTPTI